MIADFIHMMIERFGLVAVFVDCLAEGETAAIVGGFLAHQRLYPLWTVYAVVAGGAFLGDTGLFLAGRHFASLAMVRSLTRRPVFVKATGLVAAHPNIFVLTNRFIYGMRAVGGVAAGFSGIGLPHFAMLNAISSAVWAGIFVGFGYVFGLGAEAIIGDALVRHERLVAIVVIAAIGVAGGLLAARFLRRRAARQTMASGGGQPLPDDDAPHRQRHDHGDQHRQ